MSGFNFARKAAAKATPHVVVIEGEEPFHLKPKFGGRALAALGRAEQDVSALFEVFAALLCDRLDDDGDVVETAQEQLNRFVALDLEFDLGRDVQESELGQFLKSVMLLYGEPGKSPASPPSSPSDGAPLTPTSSASTDSTSSTSSTTRTGSEPPALVI